MAQADPPAALTTRTQTGTIAGATTRAQLLYEKGLLQLQLKIEFFLFGHVGVEEGANPGVPRTRVGLNPGNAGVGEFFLGKGVLRTRDRGFLFFSHFGSAFGLGYVGDRVQSVPG